MINNFSRTKATDFLLYGGTTGTDNSWMSCEMGSPFSGPVASGSPLSLSYLPPARGSSSVDDLISELEVSIFPWRVWASRFLQFVPCGPRMHSESFSIPKHVHTIAVEDLLLQSKDTGWLTLSWLTRIPQLQTGLSQGKQRKKKWLPLAWVLSALVRKD